MTIACADPWAACQDYLATTCWCHEDVPQPDVNRRYALVLWTFAECLAAQTILEIGIGPTAASGCTFLHHLAQRPHGHLLSVDIDPTLPLPVYRALAVQCGVAWTVIHGDSLEVAVPLSPGAVDLLYIDGNHDAVHAEGDLLKFLPYLRPGGYLLIDDFPPQKGLGLGRPAIDAMIPGHLHLAHAVPHGNGRLVWQRPL
ncbi:MAG: hypothetical protein EWM73_03403 [Nitrospira sp.]|nr:MAG: hypothetical protein EWM73_03403 [Nitrospira sp.]